MKDLKLSTHKQKIFVTLLASVLLSPLLLSCGNKGGSSSEGGGNPAPIYGSSAVLPGGELPLATAVSQGPDDLPFTVSWTIMGQAPLVQQLQWMTTSPAKVYQGSTVARGTLTITVSYPAMGCLIPAGTYQIYSTAPGIWNAGTFQFHQLMAQSGSLQLQIAMTGVVVDPNGDSQVDRLAGNFQILRVINGTVQNCFVNSFSVF